MFQIKLSKIAKKLIKSELALLTLITVIIAFIYFPVYHFSFLIGWDDQWFVGDYSKSGHLFFCKVDLRHFW